MRGIILNFSIQENTGCISGDDGKRYAFTGKEWKETFAPEKGKKVDFEVNVSSEACSVYCIMYQENDANKLNIGSHIADDTHQKPTPQITESYINQLEVEKTYGTMSWFKKCMKNYVNFAGRARRSEFWNFVLMICFIQIIPSIIISITTYFITANQYRSYSYYSYSSGIGMNDFAQIFGISFVMAFIVTCAYCFICSCIFLLPSIAVTARRLHDIGLSGWWASLIILTYISPLLMLMGGIFFAMIVYIVICILFIVWCSTDTKPQANEWGLPAK
ncbi:DUF805 domain-containing protein [Commensalibacter communis]|uniref:DUF805 domain-containing protein n=1 Tax=Commensalibacter communis TaxID=2972786 RepID=UPI0022FFC3CE|nr:DUF805 domain-containing protein [Commensalibacter communis]CAI3947546.1 DUF805 family (yhaH) [Commensalibacter communis]CAI3947772.1 DUF805 family (yhaH) [Commensalibacter communis]